MMKEKLRIKKYRKGLRKTEGILIFHKNILKIKF